MARGWISGATKHRPNEVQGGQKSRIENTEQAI